MPSFPTVRMRRLRRSPTLRRMVRETVLTADDLIYPLFVIHGKNQQRPIGSMPGQHQWSVDMLPRQAEEIAELGIPAVILFGLPAAKDAIGSENFADDGIAQQRSEEHTSELQSRQYLVCRLLLEKKKKSLALSRIVLA